MIILALVVVGAASYFHLGVDRFPAVDLPTVRVRTTLPGASPEEVETLSFAAHRRSRQYRRRHRRAAFGFRAGAPRSSWPRSTSTATSTSRRRTCATASPRCAAVCRPEPTLPSFRNSTTIDSPILTIALSGDRSLRELTELADKIVKMQLERSAGVGEVAIVGGMNAPSTSGSMPTGSRPTRFRSPPCATPSFARTPTFPAAM